MRAVVRANSSAFVGEGSLLHRQHHPAVGTLGFLLSRLRTASFLLLPAERPLSVGSALAPAPATFVHNRFLLSGRS